MDVNYNFAIIFDLPIEIHRGSECQGPERRQQITCCLLVVCITKASGVHLYGPRQEVLT